ncbi:MAG TPA: S41 family peptidase [Longimicrobium sp.]|nr:S41 family peptidase [Longimicrobium sp.]
MHTLSRTAAAMLALVLALPAHAPAQMQQDVNPQPIAATHPNAQRAGAVVERILAGDRAGALEVLRREGDPAFVAGPMETAVDRAIARLGPAGRWQIAGFEAAGIDADVIVRLRSGDARENIAVRMQAAPPHRIVGFARAGQDGPGPGAGPAAASAAARGAPLTAADQQGVVDRIGELLEEMYVAADTGRMIADRLRERQRAGAYAAATAPQAFAAALTQDLQAVNGDRHLRVTVGGPGMMQPGAAPAHQGFERVERLSGNVAYVRIAGPLRPTPAALEAATAALRQTADADAVILDLRGVPGGAATMVDHIVSYFVAPGTPLVQVYNRSENQTVVRRALDAVPGPRRLDVPLYVLVDEGSFSAAESLSFILQSLGRATIVGQRTRGGGRNNEFIPVGHGLVASITFTRVTDPRTGRGWEGVGIQPDVAVPAADALTAAHRHALERLGRTGS